jgi:ssDNA thymidine ADP-ribosyltransferase, DarT
MSPIPENPKIYHITHVKNIAKIIHCGVLWSDAERIRRGFDCEVVGMSEIKRRRLEEIAVDCHPGTMVGHYVPFYFCPRSIMLYILHRGNHPDLTYHGGQRPIVHLRADLQEVLKWTKTMHKRWTFSKGNAGAYYADFSDDPAKLNNLDWEAIPKTDWRDPDVKEAKQAEFLVEKSFPWELIESVGVMDADIAGQVAGAVNMAGHQPKIRVKPAWYY